MNDFIKQIESLGYTNIKRLSVGNIHNFYAEKEGNAFVLSVTKNGDISSRKTEKLSQAEGVETSQEQPKRGRKKNA